MNYYEHHLGDDIESRLKDAIAFRDAAKSPREKSRANARIRSIRMEAARSKGTHTDSEWRLLVDQLQHRCAACGLYGLSVPMQKDHIIPVYQGGSDAISNLQPLCAACNASKGPDNFNWAAYRLQFGFGE